MATRLNDNEGFAQVLLGITAQDNFQFGMNGIYRRRRDTKVNDATAFSFEKNQPPEITVTRDKNALILRSLREQIRVIRLRHAHCASRENVVSQFPKMPLRDGVNVLVEKKSHDAETCRSSAAMTSRAYWMQARMSSAVRSG